MGSPFLTPPSGKIKVMHTTQRLCGVTLLGLTLSFPAMIIANAAMAEDLYVISNPGIKVTPEEIREVYLGEKQFAGSVRIIPVDNKHAQTIFLSKVIKLEQDKYNTSWTKKTFRDGLNPPLSKSGDDAVIKFVKTTPGAVGYVTTKPSGVSVIGKY